MCSRCEFTGGVGRASSRRPRCCRSPRFLVQRYAQAFPSFGSERTGAPVVAYCRIDDKEIRLREPVMKPDALIIQDPTLLHQVDLFAGLAADGYILINTNRSFAELRIGEFVGSFRPERLLHGAGDRTRAAARRQAGSQRRAARGFRGNQRTDFARRRRRRDPREIPGEDRRRQCRGRDRGLRGGACLSKSRVPRPSPKRSLCAGRK